MQVFADDGTPVDVRVDGANGTPIVLLAGFPLTRALWKTQADALSATHRVLRPELRGIGSSSIPDGPYLMETLAADVATMLDALGIGQTAIAGHSMGGYVALAFARMFSERITHLALVCSRLGADTAERAAARRRTADRVEEADSTAPLVDEYLSPLVSGSDAADRNDIEAQVRQMADCIEPKGAAALLRGMALRASSEDIAADLDVPVAVVAGARDANVPLEEARTMAAAFPKGRLIVCERSGHLPMLEEPAAVGAALEALLSE